MQTGKSFLALSSTQTQQFSHAHEQMRPGFSRKENAASKLPGAGQGLCIFLSEESSKTLKCSEFGGDVPEDSSLHHCPPPQALPDVASSGISTLRTCIVIEASSVPASSCSWARALLTMGGVCTSIGPPASCECQATDTGRSRLGQVHDYESQPRPECPQPALLFSGRKRRSVEIPSVSVPPQLPFLGDSHPSKWSQVPLREDRVSPS